MNTYLFKATYRHKIKGTIECRVYPVRHEGPYAVLDVWDLAFQEAEIRKPEHCCLAEIVIMEVYLSEN